MKKQLFTVSICLLSSGIFGQTNSDTLYYTGAEQSWTVPCGAQNISIITYGAQGDSGSTITPGTNVGGLAGLGNSVTENWNSLVPTNILYIYVGGQAVGSAGGFNGGGNGVANPAANPSGGGGGATDIRYPSNALTDRVQVAGGGGGGGNAGLHAFGAAITGGNGGNGGGNQLLNGNSIDGQIGTNTFDGDGTYFSGQPGTSTGGAFAPGCSGFLGQNGSTATSEIGANGGQGNNGFSAAQTTMAPSGGAGGGGYFGGNGGGGGSGGTTGCSGNGFGPGGGGSAGTNFPSTATAENGVRFGAGLVIINYDIVIDSSVIDESFTTPCVGQTVNIDATPAGGTFDVTSGSSVFSGAAFSPIAQTNYFITYTSESCGVESVDTFEVNINCDIASIEEIESVFKMFPNPVTNNVTISNILGASIQITDLTGKVVYSENQMQNETINCSAFNTGVYLVQINKNNKNTILKLVKE